MKPASKPISYVFGGVSVFEVNLVMDMNVNIKAFVAASGAEEAIEAVVGEHVGHGLQTIKLSCKPLSYQKLRIYQTDPDGDADGERFLKILHRLVKSGEEFPSIIAEDTQ